MSTSQTVNYNTINIYQKNWAFTTSDSDRTQIKTGSFGPCYVVTFTSGKFAAMAHIDDTTNVDSITAIFDKFKENSVALADVKVTILGGWEEHPESFKWGLKIVKKITGSGFENLNVKKMHSTRAIPIAQQIQGITKSELFNHYHLGALVDAVTGKTFILKEYSDLLDQEQMRKNQKFAEEYGLALDVELDLSQII